MFSTVKMVVDTFPLVRTMSSFQLYGMYGSPYTRKVEAAMRYKRIPFTKHKLTMISDWETPGFGHIKPKVIPVVKFPDGSSKNDSTPLLQSLDRTVVERPLLPPSPGQKFVSLLLEDLFDEWLVKVMFGMRWIEEVDRDWSGSWIMYDTMMGGGTDLDNVKEIGRQFADRQYSRMHLVGCKDPVLVKRSLRQIFRILESHVNQGNMFLIGQPTVADFALYGQASQLVIDTTPDVIMRKEFPGSWAWVRAMEDQSGHDSDEEWEVTEAAKEMMRFAADVYLPFLAANRAALANGEKEVRLGLWGGEVEHRQPVFKYQEKCYQILEKIYRELPESERGRCREILGETRCLQYFQ